MSTGPILPCQPNSNARMCRILHWKLSRLLTAFSTFILAMSHKRTRQSVAGNWPIFRTTGLKSCLPLSLSEKVKNVPTIFSPKKDPTAKIHFVLKQAFHPRQRCFLVFGLFFSFCISRATDLMVWSEEADQGGGASLLFCFWLLPQYGSFPLQQKNDRPASCSEKTQTTRPKVHPLSFHPLVKSGLLSAVPR